MAGEENAVLPTGNNVPNVRPFYLTGTFWCVIIVICIVLGGVAWGIYALANKSIKEEAEMNKTHYSKDSAAHKEKESVTPVAPTPTTGDKALSLAAPVPAAPASMTSAPVPVSAPSAPAPVVGK
jgi:hypothetical protein